MKPVRLYTPLREVVMLLPWKSRNPAAVKSGSKANAVDVAAPHQQKADVIHQADVMLCRPFQRSHP
jgi:hypothetical protein